MNQKEVTRNINASCHFTACEQSCDDPNGWHWSVKGGRQMGAWLWSKNMRVSNVTEQRTACRRAHEPWSQWQRVRLGGSRAETDDGGPAEEGVDVPCVPKHLRCTSPPPLCSFCSLYLMLWFLSKSFMFLNLWKRQSRKESWSSWGCLGDGTSKPRRLLSYRIALNCCGVEQIALITAAHLAFLSGTVQFWFWSRSDRLSRYQHRG